MLHTPINDVGHRPYCGPTAIAAITGAPISVVYKKLRRVRADGDRRRYGKVVNGGNVKRVDGKKRRIVGTGTTEVLKVLKRLGYPVVARLPQHKRPAGITLRQLCDDRAHLGPHLVEVTGHWIAMSRGMLCDTHRRTPVPWKEHPLLRSKVIAWWVFPERPPVQPE